MPLRPHDLRNTAVALWIAAGANTKQIATCAGHTSVPVVLDRYGHLFERHETAVLDRLDGSVAWTPVASNADESAGSSGFEESGDRHRGGVHRR